MEFIKVEKDKKYLFKDEIKNDPRKLEEFNSLLKNLNNPSMGIGFLKKIPNFIREIPCILLIIKGIYETNIEKNFCKKNLKDILIAKKTANATNKTANATNKTLFKTVDTNNITKVKKLKWFLDNKKSNFKCCNCR